MKADSGTSRGWLQRRGWTDTVSICQYCIAVDGADGGGCSGRATDTLRRPEDWEWGSRLPRLMAEMDSVACDVYCLQGVQHSKYTAFLEPLFSQRGFKGRISTSSATADAGLGAVYCAVFVREASIRLVEHAVVPLAVEAKAWAAANPGPVSTEVLEALQKSKDHVLLTRLTHLGTGRDFVVVSTRFSVKDRAELQAVQAALLCQTTVAHLKQWGLDSTSNAPVMLCGDLHSQPRHGAGHGGAQGAYLLLTEGNLSPEHADHPGYQTTGTRSKSLNSSLLKLRSVYATCESGNEPLFTCNTSSFQGTRDYIMVGGALSIIDKLGMPYAEGQGVGYPTLPNQAHPSEHLMLASRLEIC